MTGPWYARIEPSRFGYHITVHTDQLDGCGGSRLAFTRRGAERVGRRAAGRMNRREARGRWTVYP